MRRLGILGGTFNPPHRAHVALAVHARRELRLDEVLLVPANAAPNKPAGGRSGCEDGRAAGRTGGRPDGRAGGRAPTPEDRLAMCRLAVADVAGVSVCPIEIERGGVSYTVDTLEALHAGHPQTELTLILGADVAATMPSWRRPARLAELASVAVAGRPGETPPRVLETERVSFLDMPPLEVSSSIVRARVARGEPIEELVGPAVAGYIAEHRLYLLPDGAGSQR